ncbi:hypothetical protein BDR04DRAFT_1086235 [Suillus decipiens]|nr:hypothetical protein BDR04DRAFT_1086235 [Suillus decipiens]
MGMFVIALCGNEQLWDAMEAFYLAITFSDRNPVTVDILLLIKAVGIFSAGCDNEALRRVQYLATSNSGTCFQLYEEQCGAQSRLYENL